MRRELPWGFSIRRAREGDLPALAALWDEPEAYAILDLCRAADTLWAAADGDDVPQGFAAASELDGTLHLAGLCVAGPHRGRGLGSALLDAVVEHGRWAYHPAVSLVTQRNAIEGGSFFAARGFLTLRPEALSPGLRAKVATGEPGLVAMARRL